MSLVSNLPRLLVICLASGCVSVSNGDELVLRDLTEYSGVTIESFDQEGITFTKQQTASSFGRGRQVVGWDEVESATTSEVQQGLFDRMLSELGDPLFRIHRRLLAGDYYGLDAPSEKVFDRYRNGNSKQSYIVCQAAMWGRLANGNPEGALEAYLLCLRYARTMPVYIAQVPGDRRFQYYPSTGMTDDLLPLFVDQKRAAKYLPRVVEIVEEMEDIEMPPLGIYGYVSALAIAANQPVEAEKWRIKIDSPRTEFQHLSDLLQAQKLLAMDENEQVVGKLKDIVIDLNSTVRPVAYYLLGIAESRSTDQQEQGVLDLLHVPALYGRMHPELSAASLVEVHKLLLKSEQKSQAEEIEKHLRFFYDDTLPAERYIRTLQRASNT